MPIYLYRCESCGDNQELLQKAGDPPPPKCAACGAEGTMRKKIAPVGIIFKGSGFHKNDYSGSGGGSKSSGSTTPAAETKTESATPSTPAPAPAPSSSSDSGSSSNS